MTVSSENMFLGRSTILTNGEGFPSGDTGTARTGGFTAALPVDCSCELEDRCGSGAEGNSAGSVCDPLCAVLLCHATPNKTTAAQKIDL